MAKSTLAMSGHLIHLCLCEHILTILSAPGSNLGLWTMFSQCQCSLIDHILTMSGFLGPFMSVDHILTISVLLGLFVSGQHPYSVDVSWSICVCGPHPHNVCAPWPICVWTTFLQCQSSLVHLWPCDTILTMSVLLCPLVSVRPHPHDVQYPLVSIGLFSYCVHLCPCDILYTSCVSSSVFVNNFSKHFSSGTIWPIGTKLCMNVFWGILHRTDVGSFDPSKNMSTITKNRT